MLEIVKVGENPLPHIFFCLPSTAADNAVVNPSGSDTFLVRGITALVGYTAIILKSTLRKPPDRPILFK